MEQVLHTYSLPYNPKRPGVCFDERPCFLIGDVLHPIAMKAGQSKREDYQGGSFYKHLDPDTAFTLAQRFDWLYTPNHASWLTMAELEFSALSRQCLNRRIASQILLEQEVLAWVKDRNETHIMVTWQFSIERARTKFARHY